MMSYPVRTSYSAPASPPGGKLWIFRVPGVAGALSTLIVRVSEAQTRKEIALMNLLHLQDPEEVLNLTFHTPYLIECKEGQCGCYVQGTTLEFTPTPEKPVGCVSVQYANCCQTTFGIYGGCFCGAKVLIMDFIPPEEMARLLEAAPDKAKFARRVLMTTAVLAIATGAVGGVRAARGAHAASEMELGATSQRFRKEMIEGNTGPNVRDGPALYTSPQSQPRRPVAAKAMSARALPSSTPNRPVAVKALSARTLPSKSDPHLLSSKVQHPARPGEKIVTTTSRRTIRPTAGTQTTRRPITQAPKGKRMVKTRKVMNPDGSVTVTKEIIDSEGNKTIEVTEIPADTDDDYKNKGSVISHHTQSSLPSTVSTSRQSHDGTRSSRPLPVEEERIAPQQVKEFGISSGSPPASSGEQMLSDSDSSSSFSDVVSSERLMSSQLPIQQPRQPNNQTLQPPRHHIQQYHGTRRQQAEPDGSKEYAPSILM